MPLNTQDQDPQQQYSLVACIDNAKNITHLLKAISFKDHATVLCSSNGLKVTVEHSSCVQANAFIQAEIFQEFTLTEENLAFDINLNVLLDCLKIFGGGSSSGSTPALKMCYEGYGSPLVLLLEESGVITDCSIKTLEAEDTLDFHFSGENVLNRLIMKSDCLKEIFSELDASSDSLEILMSPDPPYFRLSTVGNSATNHIDIPKDSDVMESFLCTSTVTFRYKQQLLKPSVKALSLSQKVSIRTDDRGILSLQFMVKTEDGHICFVDYLCCPDDDDPED